MNDYDTDDRNPRGFDDRGRWLEAARARVKTPGTILLIFGLISLFLAVLSLAIYIISPDTIYRPQHQFMVDLQKGQPAGQQQPVPPYEQFVKEQQIQNLAFSALSVLGSIPIVIGGSKMKSLTGYGWGIAGSILAIIPCTNSCCCLALPFGIWSLVVLLNADVKLAFSRVAAGPSDAEMEME